MNAYTPINPNDFTNQADFWNAEGEAKLAHSLAVIESLPAGTIQTNSGLKALDKLSKVQQSFINRVAEHGDNSTIIFIWNNGKYSTFGSDAMRAIVTLQIEGSAVDGVLQVDQTSEEIKALIIRAENIRHTVRRFNN